MADDAKKSGATSDDAKNKVKVRSGRVTPKGGGTSAPMEKVKSEKSDRALPASGRYTAPVPKEFKVSPPWVPVLMFTFFILGFLVIVLNYLPDILPGSPANGYLIAGLALITCGFITATRYH